MNFPRPANDNSLGVHLWTGQLFGDELEQWLDRVTAMGLKHVTTLQTDLGFMQACARRGLQVYCRPFYRANKEWGDDGSCVENMITAGLPPLIQIYNEPDLLGTEWENEVPGDYDWAMRTWADRWLAAAQYVYARGGWPGIQTLDVSWYEYLLNRIKNELPVILDRLWRSDHNYTSNHGPKYPYDIGLTIEDDWFCILSPLKFWNIDMRVLGRKLPAVSNEGGYCVGDAADNRFPTIDEALHAKYTVEMFNMFKTGVLTNGESLPDEWIAVTPWLLAAVRTNNDSAFEQNAWYGAWHADRQTTIDGVKAMSNFIRPLQGQNQPPEEEEPPMATLAEQFPDVYAAWVAAGGDPEAEFRSYLVATGRIPGTRELYSELAGRIRSHVAELEAIGLQLPKA